MEPKNYVFKKYYPKYKHTLYAITWREYEANYKDMECGEIAPDYWRDDELKSITEKCDGEFYVVIQINDNEKGYRCDELLWIPRHPISLAKFAEQLSKFDIDEAGRSDFTYDGIRLWWD